MAHEATRRNIVKFAAILTLGAGTSAAVSGEQSGQSAKNSDTDKVTDEILARAKRTPESFMLSEPETIVLDTDEHSRDLVITSARDENGKPSKVFVPSRSVRIFRADSTLDEFTSGGGIYWQFRGLPGKAPLKKSLGLDGSNELYPGSIVMVVRDDKTVRLYRMSFDLRC